jgi:hypothetical protein
MSTYLCDCAAIWYRVFLLFCGVIRYICNVRLAEDSYALFGAPGQEGRVFVGVGKWRRFVGWISDWLFRAPAEVEAQFVGRKENGRFGSCCGHDLYERCQEKVQSVWTEVVMISRRRGSSEQVESSMNGICLS